MKSLDPRLDRKWRDFMKTQDIAEFIDVLRKKIIAIYKSLSHGKPEPYT